MVSIKGQIEMMGLVIIVVLLVVIGLIVLAFNLNSPGNNDNDNFLTIKANSLMNSLYNSDLGNQDFKNTMSSCCSGSQQDCSIIEEVFLGISGNIDENVSLTIDQEYFSGDKCEFFVSSVEYFYSSGCSNSIRICK